MRSIKQHIRCGRHSGFDWCCILWYITGWRLILKLFNDQGYKWGLNTYHKWMDQRQPKGKSTYIHAQYRNSDTVVAYSIKETKDWGMIPCPICLFRKRRTHVKACFCVSWLPHLKEEVKTKHKDLVE